MSLYHYTTGQKLIQIMECGYLKPSAAGGKPDERPLLWFSTSKNYEPTALKMVVCPFKKFRVLSQKEQRELVGNVRFRLRLGSVILLNWRESCKVAEISTKERKGLENAGKEMGANPKNWFSTLNCVPVEALSIEIETADGWKPMEVSA
jgi:hypothetical protein